MGILEAKHLSKKFQMGSVEVEALVNVTFSAKKGEFVAVMGPSGSGKSTLLHLLGGIDRPSEGEITLDQEKLSDLTDKEITLIRRRKIGFVFQFFNLIPTLTAEENLALPFLIDGKHPQDFRERLAEVLKLVGLEERRNHKPDELSGGEQQRVAIGRAIVTQPAIVLADEPTGNLDSKTGDEILRLIRRSCEQFNQTVILVTHNPKAAAYADRVIYLKDGTVVDELKLGKTVDDAPVIAKLKELRI